MKYQFNINPLTKGGSIEEPSVDSIRNTLGLFRASLEDAVRYGGTITKSALSQMNLRGDREYTIVDVKVHMLMAGQNPAIPGWHTDGVPRKINGSPSGGPPDLPQQLTRERDPRYHIMVTGQHCLTEFLAEPVTLDIPDEVATSTNLYKWMSRKVQQKVGEGELETFHLDPCQVYEFGWWDIHRGIFSTGREWRYLIRVTESDSLPPRTDLNEVIRTQHNVYAPEEFGW